MRCKTERGDREDRDDVLTRVGDERERPDFAGQRRRRVPVTRAAAASGLCAGRRRGWEQLGARARACRARPRPQLYRSGGRPRLGTHAKAGGGGPAHLLPGGRAQMGHARARVGRSRLGRAFGLGPGRKG
jgi:hypothetical protein